MIANLVQLLNYTSKLNTGPTAVSAKKTTTKEPSNTTPQPVAVKSTKNGENYKSNTKHTLNQPGNRPNAGIEPKNSLELFNKSYQSGGKRYAMDANGNIHQFTYTNAGDNTWHWAGRTGKDQ